jgi:hypothetical protein
MKRTKGISRRDLLKSAGAAAAVGTLGGSEVWSLRHPQRDRAAGPRVLALISDRYHNSDYIRVSLDRLFSELSIQADYTTSDDKLSRSLLVSAIFGFS